MGWGYMMMIQFPHGNFKGLFPSLTTLTELHIFAVVCVSTGYVHSKSNSICPKNIPFSNHRITSGYITTPWYQIGKIYNP